MRSGRGLYDDESVRHPLPMMVFTADAGIQRSVAWIPACRGDGPGSQAIYEALDQSPG
jgi:hypothetical protein